MPVTHTVAGVHAGELESSLCNQPRTIFHASARKVKWTVHSAIFAISLPPQEIVGTAQKGKAPPRSMRPYLQSLAFSCCGCVEVPGCGWCSRCAGFGTRASSPGCATPSRPGPESGFAGSQGRTAVSPCASGICVDVDTEAQNSTAGLGSGVCGRGAKSSPQAAHRRASVMSVLHTSESLRCGGPEWRKAVWRLASVQMLNADAMDIAHNRRAVIESLTRADDHFDVARLNEIRDDKQRSTLGRCPAIRGHSPRTPCGRLNVGTT